MSSKSFEEASEQVRRLLEVAGGSCDAYAPTPDPAPACPLPKKNYRVWEEDISSPLLDTPPVLVAARAAPDWLEGGNFTPAHSEPTRDELDGFIRESLGGEFDSLVDVHDCCGCSCHVCKDEHASGQHTEKCLTRFQKGVQKPAAKEDEDSYETECGGVVQVYRGETAHPPITNEYALIGSVDDGGELLAIYTAFQQAQLDGTEEIQVKMDTGNHTLYNTKGRMELVDDVKGIRYIKADMAEMNHYAPIVEDRDIFIWVIPTPEHQQGAGDDLGYIHDGWSYGRLGRE